MLYLLIICISIMTKWAHAEDLPTSQEEKAPENHLSSEEIARISEAFGHLIGKNIENIGIHLDVDKVVRGLQDSSMGKQSPMDEAACVQAISLAQQASFREQSAENLEKADIFLSENEKASDVVTLVDKKLQYKILKKGTSSAIVEEHGIPLIRYTGKYLDGTIFVSSKEDEVISLDEMIPGFAKGLIGMQEGEKRELFIHPGMAYETSGYLMPNALLIFEVEVVKASSDQKDALQSTSVQISSSRDDLPADDKEVASPLEIGTSIR